MMFTHPQLYSIHKIEPLCAIQQSPTTQVHSTLYYPSTNCVERTRRIKMITEILVFIFTTIVFYALYTYKRGHYYFQSRGLKYIQGVPLFGNTLRSTFGGHHMIYDIDQVYKAFPNEK